MDTAVLSYQAPQVPAAAAWMGAQHHAGLLLAEDCSTPPRSNPSAGWLTPGRASCTPAVLGSTPYASIPDTTGLVLLHQSPQQLSRSSSQGATSAHTCRTPSETGLFGTSAPGAGLSLPAPAPGGPLLSSSAPSSARSKLQALQQLQHLIGQQKLQLQQELRQELQQEAAAAVSSAAAASAARGMAAAAAAAAARAAAASSQLAAEAAAGVSWDPSTPGAMIQAGAGLMSVRSATQLQLDPECAAPARLQQQRDSLSSPLPSQHALAATLLLDGLSLKPQPAEAGDIASLVLSGLPGPGAMGAAPPQQQHQAAACAAAAAAAAAAGPGDSSPAHWDHLQQQVQHMIAQLHTLGVTEPAHVGGMCGPVPEAEHGCMVLGEGPEASGGSGSSTCSSTRSSIWGMPHLPPGLFQSLGAGGGGCGSGSSSSGCTAPLGINGAFSSPAFSALDAMSLHTLGRATSFGADACIAGVPGGSRAGAAPAHCGGLLADVAAAGCSPPHNRQLWPGPPEDVTVSVRCHSSDGRQRSSSCGDGGGGGGSSHGAAEPRAAPRSIEPRAKPARGAGGGSGGGGSSSIASSKGGSRACSAPAEVLLQSCAPRWARGGAWDPKAAVATAPPPSKGRGTGGFLKMQHDALPQAAPASSTPAPAATPGAAAGMSGTGAFLPPSLRAALAAAAAKQGTAAAKNT